MRIIVRFMHNSFLLKNNCLFIIVTSGVIRSDMQLEQTIQNCHQANFDLIMAVSVVLHRAEQQRMHTTDMKMLRWIQGKARKDRIRNE